MIKSLALASFGFAGGTLLQIEPNAPTGSWWIIVSTMAAAIGGMAWYIAKQHKETKEDGKENRKEYKDLVNDLKGILTSNTDSNYKIASSSDNLTGAIKELMREVKK